MKLLNICSIGEDQSRVQEAALETENGEADQGLGDTHHVRGGQGRGHLVAEGQEQGHHAEEGHAQGHSLSHQGEDQDQSPVRAELGGLGPGMVSFIFKVSSLFTNFRS